MFFGIHVVVLFPLVRVTPADFAVVLLLTLPQSSHGGGRGCSAHEEHPWEGCDFSGFNDCGLALRDKVNRQCKNWMYTQKRAF